MGHNLYHTPFPGRGIDQPSWGGADFFRAHAATSDPTLFHQVYNTVSCANGALASLGVGLTEARAWHHRVYGGFGLINTFSPQEIGYAAAYEAYRLWIHNSGLYEPPGGEMERQREALIGLAIAEATRLHLFSRPTVLHGQIMACEAAAATASLIFQENLVIDRQGYGMTGYPGTGTYPSLSGVVGSYPSTIGMGAGAVDSYGTMGTVDPYAIDYDAPYFRRRMGFGPPRRLSESSPGSGMLSPGYSSGIYNHSRVLSALYGPDSGVGGSPHVGSSVVGMHTPATAIAPVSNALVPRVTTVPTAPGQTTIIELPRHHHRSSSRRHCHKRSKSVDPIMTTSTGGFGNAASSAARTVGAAGPVGGALGGLGRGAIGGKSSPMGIPSSGMSPYPGYAGSLGTAYPTTAPGYGYGYGGLYRYY
ncbi:hypothetical protein BS17DRAFT_783215 [Gyrodon lividus]|nr:hypothetical protein BS17DRAFT_783215 [Gyrodon lividus]